MNALTQTALAQEIGRSPMTVTRILQAIHRTGPLTYEATIAVLLVDELTKVGFNCSTATELLAEHLSELRYLEN